MEHQMSNAMYLTQSGPEQGVHVSHGSGRKLSYPAKIDEQLVEWVKAEQKAGVLLSPDMLRHEALRLIQPYCYDFKASTGWLDKFLSRHKITLQTSSGRVNNNGTAIATSACINDILKDCVTDVPPKLLTVSEVANLQSLPVMATNSSNSSYQNDEDDDDEDDDENEMGKKDGALSPQRPVNPERLKAFNMFVRLFIDENLDRLVPISKQPKEKINAIIMSCQRQFPEFSDRARKRIRTYLKSCRRSTRLREPSSKPSMTHIPASQLTEVNNILARACENETQEVAKRQRLDSGESVPTYHHNAIKRVHEHTANHVHSLKVTELQKAALINTKTATQHEVPALPAFISSTLKAPLLKLSQSEVTAVRSLIDGYRQSASFLHRSADELERLLKHCEAFVDESIKTETTVETNKDAELPNKNFSSSSTNEIKVEEMVPLSVQTNDRIMLKPALQSVVSSTEITTVSQISLPLTVLSKQLNDSSNNKDTSLTREFEKVNNFQTADSPPLHREPELSGNETDNISVNRLQAALGREGTGNEHESVSTAADKSSDIASSGEMHAPELLPLHSTQTPLIPERPASPSQNPRSPICNSTQQYRILSPNIHHTKQVLLQPQSTHALHENHLSPQHALHLALQSGTVSNHSQPSHILSHVGGSSHTMNQNITACQIPSSSNNHSQQLFNSRPNHHQSQQQQAQQVRHVIHQQRQPHSASRHPSTSHQTVFSFETPTQQQVMEMRQQHMHQRLSPHPMNYHSLMSPVGSQHVHDIGRQSHMQDMNRQAHLEEMTRQSHMQDMNRQAHLEEMSRQSISEYQHVHGMMFDSHSMH